jgi:hypothetical protein
MRATTDELELHAGAIETTYAQSTPITGRHGERAGRLTLTGC